MNHYYENKLTLITGGSSGIGLALAKEITARGGNIAILARHADALEQAAAEIAACKVNADQKVYTLPADIVDYEALSAVLTKFKAEVGVPDIVINSAGVAHPGRFTALPLEIFHWMMDVNYFGTVNVLKLLLPEIQERHSGTVVNISSMAGFIGVYGYSAYGASKFAITGFSDVLRSELKPYGVQVSVVFSPRHRYPSIKIRKPVQTLYYQRSCRLRQSHASRHCRQGNPGCGCKRKIHHLAGFGRQTDVCSAKPAGTRPVSRHGYDGQLGHQKIALREIVPFCCTIETSLPYQPLRGL